MGRARSSDKEPVEDDDEIVQIAPPLEWEGERIDAADALRERGAAYGMYVNTMRALPDIRDGLKSVQRRIVFSMADSNQVFSRGTTKCARIVGNTMGKYHPHGDSSIYDALVRLGQSFTVNVPLISPQGNFGSVDGDPAAAMRYCVTGATRVELADGSSCRIDQLAGGLEPSSEQPVALQVLNRLAEPVGASKLFHSGAHPTLRLTTREGFEISGSHNHPVLCLVEQLGVPLLLWKLLEEIQPGDHVLISRTPRPAGSPAGEQELDFALLLGAWTSEGHASERRAGFNNTDADFFQATLGAYDRQVGGKRYVNERRLPSGKTLHEIDIHNLQHLQVSPLGELVGLRSEAKRVPEWVWARGAEVRRRFLQALYFGDGSCSRLPRGSVQIAYCSKSRQLLRDVQQLLLGFGVVGKISSSGSRAEQRLVITSRRDARLFAERIGFWGAKQQRLEAILAELPERSRALSQDFVPYVAAYLRSEHPGDRWLARHNVDRIERWERGGSAIRERVTDQLALRTVEPLIGGDYYYAEVTSVEAGPVQEVYSLRVDSEDHAFLTDGFVSHNTEAKLSPAASAWKSDIRPEILEYRPNFDESTQEPTVLPVDFPVLLVNGSQGIGWSLACDVPPHNLGETIEAALYVADHPQAKLDQILRRLAAPDYPSGGVIANPEVLAEAYAAGRGSFVLQGRYQLEQVPGVGQAVVITELPYQVGPSQVFQEIIDAAKAEKITEVTERPLNHSSKKGLRLVVKLKRGGNAQALIAQLLKYTSLQSTQKINFTVLRGGTPATVGLPELLQAFVDFRTEVITKRLEHERAVLLKELRRLTALRAALDVIDQVIKIIRSAKDDAAARTKLKAVVKVTPYATKKKVAIDDEQAEHILSMQLRRLNQLNRFQLDDEIKAKTERCQEIDRILADPGEILAIVKSELRAVKKSYGGDRRTQLTGGELVSGGEVEATPVEVQPAVLWASASGQGMLAPADRKGKGAPLSLGGGDRLAQRLECSTGDVALVFSASGSAFRLRLADLGLETKKNRGQALAAWGRGEQLAGVVLEGQEPYIVMVTDRGQVKRVGAEVLKGAHSGGVQAIKLGDERLLAALGHDEGDHLLVATAKGRVLRTALDDLRPVKSGAAGPVKLMKLAEGDRIVAACLARGRQLAVLHGSGMGKRVPMEEIPLKGRGGGGVGLSSPDKPSRAPAGELALLAPMEGEQLTVISASGEIQEASPAPGTRASVVKPCVGVEPAIAS